MSRVKLSPHQVERVRELIDAASKGKLNEPEDVVDEWRQLPSHDQIQAEAAVDLAENPPGPERVSIDPKQVVGASLPERLDLTRFIDVLELLLDGEFDRDHEECPVVLEFKDEYFVTADGTHRLLACKALDIAPITVEAEQIPVSE
jgi:hypothetical protein